MPLSEAGRFDNEIELVERHDQHYGIHEEDEEQCHCRASFCSQPSLPAIA